MNKKEILELLNRRPDLMDVLEEELNKEKSLEESKNKCVEYYRDDSVSGTRIKIGEIAYSAFEDGSWEDQYEKMRERPKFPENYFYKGELEPFKYSAYLSEYCIYITKPCKVDVNLATNFIPSRFIRKDDYIILYTGSEKIRVTGVFYNQLGSWWLITNLSGYNEEAFNIVKSPLENINECVKSLSLKSRVDNPSFKHDNWVLDSYGYKSKEPTESCKIFRSRVRMINYSKMENQIEKIDINEGIVYKTKQFKKLVKKLVEDSMTSYTKDDLILELTGRKRQDLYRERIDAYSEKMGDVYASDLVCKDEHGNFKIQAYENMYLSKEDIKGEMIPILDKHLKGVAPKPYISSRKRNALKNKPKKVPEGLLLLSSNGIAYINKRDSEGVLVSMDCIGTWSDCTWDVEKKSLSVTIVKPDSFKVEIPSDLEIKLGHTQLHEFRWEASQTYSKGKDMW